MREYIIAIDEKDVTMCFINGMRNAELIRCKDCKYYEPYDCGLHTGTWFPESYCDMAERKEE